ncbi:MAG TPA: oligosaccharide flippase family protein [Chloroflexi bacterium]|nr:oligosaccharide flippase family protein [Chloroflexota bacterium]
MRDQGRRQDLGIILLFAVLALVFCWPVTVGGKTMLPADSAFQWQPWRSYAAQVGVEVPHNDLLNDLYLESYVWKCFIVDALQQRQIPLWNPYILTGVPFLAAGQHSAMYPLSVLFYVLPIHAAFGWFTALHLFLAALNTYILARTLRVGRGGAAVGAVTFAFGGFMAVRTVFPMIIAAAVWLPLILTMIERIAQRAEAGERRLLSNVPELVGGTLAFGMVFLAGHPEMYYYVALSAGAFAAYRLVRLAWRVRSWRARSWRGLLVAALVLGAMALLGLGLGTAQWLPSLELVRHNFRDGSASLAEIRGWALPRRHLLAFLIPDFYGNPTHHGYLDLFTGQWTPATVNARGEPIRTIFWGIKNYVEGGSYVGLLPLLLAGVAIVRRRGRYLGFWAAFAALCLLFAFGTPLYGLVYALPGMSQVHSPFRWIYPYTLVVGLLAGMGCDALWAPAEDGEEAGWRRWARRLSWPIVPAGTLAVGAAGLVGLGVSLLAKECVAALCQALLPHLARAEEAFADGRMFFSYQFRNLLILALALVMAGGVLLARRAIQRRALWAGLALAVVAAELFVIGKPFLPAVDPALIAYRTPAIDFLLEQEGLFRITTLVGGDEKTLNANMAMMYGLQDVRGYDSIIPRQYVEYMELIQPQGELPYNRIAPLSVKYPEALDSPLLDMLNARYVITVRERSIDRPGYTLVYDGEVRIYRNDDAMPRAFLVPRGENIPDAEARRQALRTLDPREVVILEETPRQAPAEVVPDTFTGAVQDIAYTPNEVTITVDTPIPCFLVLGDAFYDGWLAFMRPAEALQPELEEERLHIYRANGNFRAVEVPAGRHVVRFKYSPNPVKYGLYASFMSGMVLVLLGGCWAWRRFYREPRADADVQRVIKNTMAPMTLTLMNRVIDMAFAMLLLRILGPVDSGQYTLAVVIIAWFDILTNFGLNALVTREVAKDKDEANRYFVNTAVARVGLCFASLPVLAAFVGFRQWTSPLPAATVLAILLYWVALLPSNVSASVSAIFSAHERMEIPAIVTTVTTVLRVTLGAAALIAGHGYVGYAGVSIVVNVITMLILYSQMTRLLFRPRCVVDLGFQGRMLLASYPLMINHLLATLFFKVAVLLLEMLAPDPRVVGWYGTAYKYVDAVQVVPSFFTMALFPLMARYAASDHDALLRTYRLAAKLLLAFAVPIALVGWALSSELIGVLGGSQYLPQSAEILQVMIWYMPFGFINSVTQYVLIALDQQRYLTRAFVLGLAFNVVGNLLLIPRFGYMASAYVAVASELVLLIPFYAGIRRYLATIPWPQLAWKQALSALPMALLVVLAPPAYRPLTIVPGLVAYAAGFWLLKGFDAQEREVVGRVLPLGGVRRRLRAAVDALARG